MFFKSTKDEVLKAAEKAASDESVLQDLMYYRTLIRSVDSEFTFYYGNIDEMTVMRILRYRSFQTYLCARIFEKFGIETDCGNMPWSCRTLPDPEDDGDYEDVWDDLLEDVCNAPGFTLEDLEVLGSRLDTIPLNGVLGEYGGYEKLFTDDNIKTTKDFIKSLEPELRRDFFRNKILKRMLDNFKDFSASDCVIAERSIYPKKMKKISAPDDEGISRFLAEVTDGCQYFKLEDNFFLQAEGKEETLAISDFYYDEEMPFYGYVGEEYITGTAVFDRFCAMVCVFLAERGGLQYSEQ